MLLHSYFALGPVRIICYQGEVEYLSYFRKPDRYRREALAHNPLSIIKDLYKKVDEDPFPRLMAVNTVCTYGYLKAVKYFHKIGVDMQGFLGGSLSVAVMNRHLPVIRYIIEECKISANEKALESAISAGYLPILKYLREKDPSLPWPMSEDGNERIKALAWAKIKGVVDSVFYALQNSRDMSVYNIQQDFYANMQDYDKVLSLQASKEKEKASFLKTFFIRKLLREL